MVEEVDRSTSILHSYLNKTANKNHCIYFMNRGQRITVNLHITLVTRWRSMHERCQWGGAPPPPPRAPHTCSSASCSRWVEAARCSRTPGGTERHIGCTLSTRIRLCFGCNRRSPFSLKVTANKIVYLRNMII